MVILTMKVELPENVVASLHEAADFNLRSVEAELAVLIKSKYKPRRAVGRPKLLGKDQPTQAILDELQELVRGGYVHRDDLDGSYVGVYAHGSGWKATAPRLGRGQTYLGVFRTKEEAAVVRARVLRTKHEEELNEQAAILEDQAEAMAFWPADPLRSAEDEVFPPGSEPAAPRDYAVAESVARTAIDALEVEQIIKEALQPPMIPIDPGTKNW